MEQETPDFNLNKLNISKKTAINSLVTASLSFIPSVGPYLAEGFNYYGKVKQERLNLFLERLNEYFNGLSNEEIEPEFLKSEDFARLFEAVLKKVSDTKSENKRETFRKILINSVGAKNVSDFSETFLNLTSQLHEKQIEILTVYHETSSKVSELENRIIKLNDEHRQNQEAWMKAPADYLKKKMIELDFEMNSKRMDVKLLIEKLNPESFAITKTEFVFYQQDLVSKCLLKDNTGFGIGIDNSIDFTVTLFGEKYLEFILL